MHRQIPDPLIAAPFFALDDWAASMQRVRVYCACKVQAVEDNDTPLRRVNGSYRGLKL